MKTIPISGHPSERWVISMSLQSYRDFVNVEYEIGNKKFFWAFRIGCLKIASGIYVGIALQKLLYCRIEVFLTQLDEL